MGTELREIQLNAQIEIENSINCAISGQAAKAWGILAKANHDYSFVWNGDGSLKNGYSSHGTGTFNISPVNGCNGLYIGNTSLASRIDAMLKHFANACEVRDNDPEY